MLPLFLMLKEVGLINSFAGVLVPVVTSIFGIFLVRQYALLDPDELLEAARVDGAGEGRIFLQIVVPVLTPILITWRCSPSSPWRLPVAADRAHRPGKNTPCPSRWRRCRGSMSRTMR